MKGTVSSNDIETAAKLYENIDTSFKLVLNNSSLIEAGLNDSKSRLAGLKDSVEKYFRELNDIAQTIKTTTVNNTTLAVSASPNGASDERSGNM